MECISIHADSPGEDSTARSSVAPVTTALPDMRWARSAGIAGIIALLAYIVLSALAVSQPVAVLLCFAFGFGLAIASIGLYLGVTRDVAPRIGLVAVGANIVGVGACVAMLVVQLAVKGVEPNPGVALTSIWLGLDVAWDLFIGAGTLLFGIALWWHHRFRPVTAGAGMVVGALLLVLNIATFPTPPAEAGVFGVWPVVGLWGGFVLGWVLPASPGSAPGSWSGAP